MMSSHHLGQHKGNFYIIDEVLIKETCRQLRPRLHGCVSNCAVFISLRFQIDPIWFAFS